MSIYEEKNVCICVIYVRFAPHIRYYSTKNHDILYKVPSPWFDEAEEFSERQYRRFEEGTLGVIPSSWHCRRIGLLVNQIEPMARCECLASARPLRIVRFLDPTVLKTASKGGTTWGLGGAHGSWLLGEAAILLEGGEWQVRSEVPTDLKMKDGILVEL